MYVTSTIVHDPVGTRGYSQQSVSSLQPASLPNLFHMTDRLATRSDLAPRFNLKTACRNLWFGPGWLLEDLSDGLTIARLLPGDRAPGALLRSQVGSRLMPKKVVGYGNLAPENPIFPSWL
jgi:hypothetical protein